MWTNEELIDVRDRAELEVGNDENSVLWQSACLSLAGAAERLIGLSSRICSGELVALRDKGLYSVREKESGAVGVLWVSVDDDLPDLNEKVLTFDVSHPGDGVEWEERIGRDDWSSSYDVSHWARINVDDVTG